MPEPTVPAAPTQPTLVKLEELAAAVAQEGAAADAAAKNSLAKAVKDGLRDGFGDLVALLKGKKVKEPDPDDTQDEDEPEDEDDKDKPPVGKPAEGTPAEPKPGEGAGFVPMGKGGEADPEFVDATDVILAQQAEIVALHKAVNALGNRIEALFSGFAENGLAPLAKGMIAISERVGKMADEPAPVADIAGPAAGRAGRRRFGLTGSEPKAADVTQVQMAKGLKAKIIDDDDIRWLKRGVVIPDECDGARKMKELRAL